jgi:hypothetical protein
MNLIISRNSLLVNTIRTTLEADEGKENEDLRLAFT